MSANEFDNGIGNIGSDEETTRRYLFNVKDGTTDPAKGFLEV